MNTCPYCKESVKEDAVKCRYCHSMLGKESEAASDNRVTYILDKDLIRFAKFTAAVLAVFGAVGLFLFGFNTEKTVENILEARDALERDQERMESIQNDLDDQQTALEQAKNGLAAAQSEMETHQNALDDQEEALEQTTNDLVAAQALLTSNQEAMSQTMAELDKTKGELALSLEEARRYLVIIVEQRDRALQLTEEQEELLNVRRSQNPEEFRDATGGTKLWPVGKTITVSFLDGDPSMHRKVEEYANEWTNYANIKFDFAEEVNSDTEIRISFEPVGSWSYVGTDSLAVSEDLPTMNLGLRPNSADDEIATEVLHEFGHVLGLLHEEQNPNANIPWNEDAVYEHFVGPPYYWSTERINHNILNSWNPDAFPIEKEFDPESVMILFAIPNELTEGDFELARHSTLSTMDKEIAGILYPDDES